MVLPTQLKYLFVWIALTVTNLSVGDEAVGQSLSVTKGQGSSIGRQVYRCLQETRRHFWNSTVLSDLPLERLEVKLCHAVMDRLPCALQSLTLGGVNHKQGNQ